ncbi:pilus assembly protein PilM [Planctomycetota bacterium]
MYGWRLKHRCIGPIGLDIGQAYVKAVQLGGDDRGLYVIDAQRARRSPRDSSPQSLSQLIRRIIQQGRFRGRQVVATLPSDGLRITSVRLTDTDLALAPQQLYRDLAERYGLDLKQEMVRCIPAGYIHHGKQTKHEVILLAANNEGINKRVHLLQDSGLTPVGLDPVACALFRCYDRTMQRLEDRTQSLIYIDIGCQFTTVILGRDHQLCFVKQLPRGANHLQQRMADTLGVDLNEVETLRSRVQQWITSCEQSGQNGFADLYEPETGQAVGLDRSTQQLIRHAVTVAVQDLAQEIALCMRYYSVTFRGHRAQRVLLSGGLAGDRMLQHSLGEQLGIEVAAAHPLDLIHPRNQGRTFQQSSHTSQWAVAMGLSLKNWEQPPIKQAMTQKQRLVPAVPANQG